MKLQLECARLILLRRARPTASTLFWNDPEPTLAYQRTAAFTHIVTGLHECSSTIVCCGMSREVGLA